MKISDKSTAVVISTVRVTDNFLTSFSIPTDIWWKWVQFRISSREVDERCKDLSGK